MYCAATFSCFFTVVNNLENGLLLRWVKYTNRTSNAATSPATPIRADKWRERSEHRRTCSKASLLKIEVSCNWRNKEHIILKKTNYLCVDRIMFHGRQVHEYLQNPLVVEPTHVEYNCNLLGRLATLRKLSQYPSECSFITCYSL